ncbi:hypothetical protein KJ660_01650 [Candidatus Micrarchaeota archaeon]|nr:hypothetical protein [Candidatus Micrarchaeota archaeon]
MSEEKHLLRLRQKIPREMQHIVRLFDSKDHNLHIKALHAMYPRKMDIRFIPFVKRELFNPHSEVRQKAFFVLAQGFNYKISKIIDYFTSKDFTRIPLIHKSRGRSPFASYYKKILKEAMKEKEIDLINAKKEGKLKEFYEKYYHRGLSVYYINEEDFEAEYYYGKILISKRIPEKFIPVLKEHELGEFISHDVGLVLEVNCAIKKGILKDYIDWTKKNLPKSLDELTYTIKEYFPEFKKLTPSYEEIKKILKKQSSILGKQKARIKLFLA